MFRFGLSVLFLLTTACAAPEQSPRPPAAVPAVPTFSQAQAATFLREIAPLDGNWRLFAFDGPPLKASSRAFLHGHEGTFLSTSGDCTSSWTSYVRDGAQIEVTQHIPPETGKCADGGSAVLDHALANAVASARSWSIDAAGRLILARSEGSATVFVRPVPRRPELNGRWVVESISSRPFQGRIDFGDEFVSAQAGCNSYGGQAMIGAGTLTVRNGVQTVIGCEKARAAAEATLFGALNGARTWGIASDGALRIEGTAPIVARRPTPATHSLPGRYQVCNNSTLPFISHDGEVWFEFDATTVRDQAGCTASYALAGAELRLTLGNATACGTPALPRRGAFEIGGPGRSPLAQFRPDGFAWDEEGRLRLRTHRGLLALCKYTPG